MMCSKEYLEAEAIQPRTVFGVERYLDIPPHVQLEEQLPALENFYGNNCEHGWFDSCLWNTKLHYRRWLPRGGGRGRGWNSNNNKLVKPKAIIVYAHGIQTHSWNTFYRAHKLNQKGYACYCHDFFRHGFSEGTRWLIPRSYKNNLADYCTFVNLVADEHPDTPIILMDESYGALLSIHLARQFQEKPETGPPNFDSVILTSPAIHVSLPPKPVVLALRYLGAPLFPTWVPRFMPNHVEDPNSEDDDDDNNDDNNNNDDDLDNISCMNLSNQIYLDSTGPFCLRTAGEIVNAMAACRKTALPGFAVPFCLVHGTDDYTCPIEGAEFMWEMTATTLDEGEPEYHALQGAGHDLFDSEFCETSTQIMTRWITKRLAKIKQEQAIV